jgi:hypothetical protein
MAKLMLKTRILQYVIDNDTPFKVDDIYKGLKPEYGAEGQFTKARIEDYLDSYVGVKFMRNINVGEGPDGEPEVTYKLTDYGKSRAKYVGR